jgi:histidinol dehydrogenase
MPLRLNSQNADFSERFRSLLAVKREAAQDVEQAVRSIVADVAAGGGPPR